VTGDDDDSIEVGPCPECSSLSTFWDPLVRGDDEAREDPEIESATCDGCGASFSLSETVLIDEGHLEAGGDES